MVCRLSDVAVALQKCRHDMGTNPLKRDNVPFSPFFERRTPSRPRREGTRGHWARRKSTVVLRVVVVRKLDRHSKNFDSVSVEFSEI